MRVGDFWIEVKISPLPKSCMDCPFYQAVYDWEDEDRFDCILHPIENSFGIAVHRYEGCPFNKEEK